MTKVNNRYTAPHVFTGNVGCVFGEQELRASLYYDSPSIPVSTKLCFNDIIIYIMVQWNVNYIYYCTANSSLQLLQN